MLLCATSCATRTVVIDRQSDVVRLGADVRGHVYLYDVKTKTWVKSGKVTLPEGWFAGPPPK